MHRGSAFGAGSSFARQPLDISEMAKANQRWLREHHDDLYVKRCRAEGYRSRAAFKLLEIDQRDRLLRSGMTVVDLGASPGGWSQVAAARVAPRGRVIALDTLPMESLPSMEFIRGDFCDPEVTTILRASLNGMRVDVVLSDLAPPFSGIVAVDQPRAMHLAELALDLTEQIIVPGGALVVKLFQGDGYDRLVAELRRKFGTVAVRKPRASRSRSREVYLVGQHYGV